MENFPLSFGNEKWEMYGHFPCSFSNLMENESNGMYMDPSRNQSCHYFFLKIGLSVSKAQDAEKRPSLLKALGLIALQKEDRRTGMRLTVTVVSHRPMGCNGLS